MVGPSSANKRGAEESPDGSNCGADFERPSVSTARRQSCLEEEAMSQAQVITLPHSSEAYVIIQCHNVCREIGWLFLNVLYFIECNVHTSIVRN